MKVREPRLAEYLIPYLQDLRKRRKRERSKRKPPRVSLSASQRREIRAKTGARCHICGGWLGRTWQADHVLAHARGGRASADNFLPAHPACNNYRWHYLPEEFLYILKLGVFARTELENETELGWEIADQFLKREAGRKRRQVGRS
jgi:5-methylcytosine-specific restriction endonuclease McrA